MVKATITMADYAPMTFELFPDKAPITVANFAQVADSGFYDGLTFCRIVRDYVIQSGSPDNDIMTDSDLHLKGEFLENGLDTGLDHHRGALRLHRAHALGRDTLGFREDLIDLGRMFAPILPDAAFVSPHAQLCRMCGSGMARTCASHARPSVISCGPTTPALIPPPATS